MSEPIIKTFEGVIPHINSGNSAWINNTCIKVDITENGNIYIYQKTDSYSNVSTQIGTFRRHYSIEDNIKIPIEYFKIFELVINSSVSGIGHINIFCTELKKLINEQETITKLLKEQKKINLLQDETNKILISEQHKKIKLLQDEIKNYEKIKLEMTLNQPYLSKYYDTDNANIIEKEDTMQIINQNNLNIFRQKYLNLTNELE